MDDKSYQNVQQSEEELDDDYQELDHDDDYQELDDQKYSDELWILCDERKWCISKTDLNENFSGTPIHLSIFNFNQNYNINEFRFTNMSPMYCDIFIKILRKELSIFLNF